MFIISIAESRIVSCPNRRNYSPCQNSTMLTVYFTLVKVIARPNDYTCTFSGHVHILHVPNKNTCTFTCHVDFHCQSNLPFCVDKILPKPYRGLPYRHPTELTLNVILTTNVIKINPKCNNLPHRKCNTI